MARTHGTDFEKPRGISRVEVRPGYAQVHVAGLADPLAPERLKVLRAVAELSVSLDFVKLTHSGIAFLVAERRADEVAQALAQIGVRHSIGRERSVVLVFAVNMRDEEGLIAGIVRKVIASGAPVEHLGDMHDRVLIVVASKDVQTVLSSFEAPGEEVEP